MGRNIPPFSVRVSRSIPGILYRAWFGKREIASSSNNFKYLKVNVLNIVLGRLGDSAKNGHIILILFFCHADWARITRIPLHECEPCQRSRGQFNIRDPSQSRAPDRRELLPVFPPTTSLYFLPLMASRLAFPTSMLGRLRGVLSSFSLRDRC